MVLKELIFNSLYFVHIWEGVVVLKELISNNFYFEKDCGGPERTDF